MGYTVSFSLFDSANYGVPQKRERMLMFGGQNGEIVLPKPTHTQDGLEKDMKKWVSIKEAFEERGINGNQSLSHNIIILGGGPDSNPLWHIFI